MSTAEEMARNRCGHYAQAIRTEPFQLCGHCTKRDPRSALRAKRGRY